MLNNNNNKINIITTINLENKTKKKERNWNGLILIDCYSSLCPPPVAIDSNMIKYILRKLTKRQNNGFQKQTKTRKIHLNPLCFKKSSLFP